MLALILNRHFCISDKIDFLGFLMCISVILIIFGILRITVIMPALKCYILEIFISRFLYLENRSNSLDQVDKLAFTFFSDNIWSIILYNVFSMYGEIPVKTNGVAF